MEFLVTFLPLDGLTRTNPRIDRVFIQECDHCQAKTLVIFIMSPGANCRFVGHCRQCGRAPDYAYTLPRSYLKVFLHMWFQPSVWQLAIQQGDVDVVRFLLQQGISVNMRQSPLLLAVKLNQLTITRLLLQAGADIQIQDHRGWTPLHHAVENHYTRLIDVLLQTGANLDTPDKNGRTPLEFTQSPWWGLLAGIDSTHTIIRYLVLYNHPKTRTMGKIAYMRACQDEVTRMQADPIPWYTILRSRHIVSHLRDPLIRHAFQDGHYKKAFPIYASQLEARFKLGQNRLEALLVGEIIMSHFKSLGPVAFNVAEYLRNVDIQHLRTTAIQIMDQQKMNSEKKLCETKPSHWV